MPGKSLPLVGAQHDDTRDPGTAVTLFAAVIDGDTIEIDAAALRGESAAERGIAFTDDRDAVPRGRRVAVVWIGVRADVEGRDGYFSAVASLLRIDAESGRGYRPERHFADMIEAIQGAVRLDVLSPSERKRLRDLLAQREAGMWERRSTPLRELWRES